MRDRDEVRMSGVCKKHGLSMIWRAAICRLLVAEERKEAISFRAILWAPHTAEESTEIFVDTLSSVGVGAIDDARAVRRAELTYSGPFEVCKGVSIMPRRQPFLYRAYLPSTSSNRFGVHPVQAFFLTRIGQLYAR